MDEAVAQSEATVFGVVDLMETGGDGVAVDFSFGTGSHRGK